MSVSTLLEILNKTTAFFESKGVPQARFDAESLIAHGLGMRRLDLYLNFDRPLTETELATLRPMVARRGQREPLQHIIGQVGWRFLDLKCDARALIPRPDTELLIDVALELLPKDKSIHVMDLGTGTGAIALAMAQEFPLSQVWAGDVSQVALDLAAENALAHGLSERVTFVRSDLALDFGPLPLLDMILSNPPYIRPEVILELEPEVRDYDPVSALDGGADGLDFYRRLLVEVCPLVKEGGWLLVEMGHGQGQALADLPCPGWRFVGLRQDLGGCDRAALWSREAHS
jgi:release factor glutamine methyltransferase